jgi:hypothetical protein
MENKMRVLIVEDELPIATILEVVVEETFHQ